MGLQNTVDMTEKRIKNFTMDDLQKVFELITQTEAENVVEAIKIGKYSRVVAILEMQVYKVAQGDRE